MHRYNARLPSWVLSHFPKKEMREMGSCLLICNYHREREISPISLSFLLFLSHSSYFSLISPISLSFFLCLFHFFLFLSHFSYFSLISPISHSFLLFLSPFSYFSLMRVHSLPPHPLALFFSLSHSNPPALGHVVFTSLCYFTLLFFPRSCSSCALTVSSLSF